MQKIKISKIYIAEANTYDYIVSPNNNTLTTDKVQSFIELFLPYAVKASTNVYNLPVKFILAQWALESGWASNKNACDSQNFGGIKGIKQKYSSNKVLKNNMTIFYGIESFTNSYINILLNVKNYNTLISYLKNTYEPALNDCVHLMAQSGYCAGNPLTYEKLLNDCILTIDKHSDFNKRYIL